MGFPKIWTLMVLTLWLGPLSGTDLLHEGYSPGQNESKKEEWYYIDNYKGDKNLSSFLCSSEVEVWGIESVHSVRAVLENQNPQFH